MEIKDQYLPSIVRASKGIIFFNLKITSKKSKTDILYKRELEIYQYRIDPWVY
jgi:hypothetical protein